MKPNSKLTIGLISALLSFSVYSEESTIYLPFPDLPREILEPMETDDLSRMNKPPEPKNTINQASQVNSGSSNERILPDEKISNERNDSGKIKTTVTSNDSNNIKTTVKRNDPKIKNTSTSQNKNIPSNKTNSSAEKNSPNTDDADSIGEFHSNTTNQNLSKPIESNKDKESLPPPTSEEKAEFQKSMAQIRSVEKKDPNSAIESYNKLNMLYTHPYFRSKILISMAWNYYYREKWLESLEICIRILEDANLTQEMDYPTAMYIAYEIHGKPWDGLNESFQKKYSSIFRANVEAGKENFTQSLYKNKISHQ